jgi:hypothetical protein
MFENRVMWRIFRSQREKVVGGWRRLHHEELHNFTKYYSRDKIKDG